LTELREPEGVASLVLGSVLRTVVGCFHGSEVSADSDFLRWPAVGQAPNAAEARFDLSCESWTASRQSQQGRRRNSRCCRRQEAQVWHESRRCDLRRR